MLSRQVLAPLSWRTAATIAAICTPLGVLVLLYLHFSRSGTLPGLFQMTAHYLISMVVMNLCGIVIWQADAWLDRRLSWKERFLARLLSGTVLNVLIAILIGLGIADLALDLDINDAIKLIILAVLGVLIYEIFYGWFYSYRYYAHHQVEWIRSERWQMELQFESLKSQISPHFLFNCLNTISSLIYKDTRLAEEFIRRMADTFQYVLSHQRRTFVSLQEEIEFVKAYYYLLQVRFENNLKLEINLPKSLMDSAIPPLTLQMLIENAVKHNVISAEQPLLVYITARDNTHLRITNSKTTPLSNQDGFRVGLDNIRKRYAFFTSAAVVVRNDERFMVELPVLNRPNGSAA
ncbi:MAG: histidine kinase [Cyclobacteriaceae bacterium]|nr:histidine kinase [Cyclobacteriaceae bacterium]